MRLRKKSAGALVGKRSPHHESRHLEDRTKRVINQDEENAQKLLLKNEKPKRIEKQEMTHHHHRMARTLKDDRRKNQQGIEKGMLRKIIQYAEI